MDSLLEEAEDAHDSGWGFITWAVATILIKVESQAYKCFTTWGPWTGAGPWKFSAGSWAMAINAALRHSETKLPTTNKWFVNKEATADGTLNKVI